MVGAVPLLSGSQHLVQPHEKQSGLRAEAQGGFVAAQISPVENDSPGVGAGPELSSYMLDDCLCVPLVTGLRTTDSDIPVRCVVELCCCFKMGSLCNPGWPAANPINIRPVLHLQRSACLCLQNIVTEGINVLHTCFQ